jgi:SAM-dependent methyltransferase
MTGDFEKTFDNVAADYESIRPAYHPAIFEDILRYQPLNADSNVLEIGMGTGSATKPFLETGCHLVGIEPGKNLAELAIKKYCENKRFTAYIQTLQEYEAPDDQFDLIYAATAFHWIPEEYGYKRVYDLLKKGGAFARFRYHAGLDKGREALINKIQALYPESMRRTKVAEFGEADAKKIADIAKSYGFSDIEYHLYQTTKDFTADEYIKLLQTYPDHMKLPEPQRNELFNGIHDAIVQNGGVITIYYVMDLELARK